MAPVRRNVAADFVRDVGARTNGNRVWKAVLNPDNSTYSVQLTINGILQPIVFPKVFWPGSGNGATSDASFGDTLNIFAIDGTVATTDTLAFLNNLN
jgi:hypothetical protein